MILRLASPSGPSILITSAPQSPSTTAAAGAAMNEPLVMIPGLMADARLFLPQMVMLGATRSLQVCVAGRGDTVEHMAELMLPDLPPKFALLGHGLGGDIALEMIRRVPDRVSRVVLMGTDPLAEPPAAAAAREARMVAARTGRLRYAMREEIPLAALADTPWRDEVMALVEDMALNLGEGVFLRQSKALQRRPDQQKNHAQDTAARAGSGRRGGYAGAIAASGIYRQPDALWQVAGHS